MAMEMNNLRPGLLGVNAPGRAPSSTTDASCVASADGRSEEDSEILREEERYQSRSVAGLSRLPKEEDLLKPYQVTAIIANRMIGTGIFDSPTAIILQTENVGWSLMLWVVGFITTMAGTLMYIEYGLTIPRRHSHAAPRSGGELNYLEYLVPGPKYFASCMFGVLFILIGNSAANAISCGVHFLAAAGITNPHIGHVQAIAIAIAWFVCVFHVLGRMLGIHLSSLFAMLKLAILCMIIIMGFMVLNNDTEHMHRDPASYANLKAENSFQTLGSGVKNHARGYSMSYLDVIFTYGGFNQANYVLAEIKRPATRYKITTLWSVGLISSLYLLVVVSYWIVVPLPRDGRFPPDFSVVSEFFKLTLGKTCGDATALRLLNAFISISSLGNVIVTTFTAARVKQEIAKRGILPCSVNIAHDVNVLEKISRRLTRNGPKDNTEANASMVVSRFQPIPLAALILHGLFTTILILATLRISSPRDSYRVVVSIYSYTINAVIGASLSLGIICMRLQRSSTWNSLSNSNRWFSLTIAAIYFIANAIPVVMLWIPATMEQLGTSIPWEVVPAVGWSLVTISFIYWLVFYYLAPVFMNGRVLEVKVIPKFRVDSQGNSVYVGERFERQWLVPPHERPAQS